MTTVTCDIGVSSDGYAAGPNQSLEHPLGEGGDRVHRWRFEQPAENAAEIEAITSAGAYIMGRNMFGPGRGDWDDEWKGWWGEEPPYHAPVFVLTHHPREPLTMEGGTTFTFVTDGIESALEQARAAAGEKTVAVAGGAATVRQYLSAGLIDELRLHIAPVVLGTGEPLLEGLDGLKLEQVSAIENELVTHITYRVLH
ncbi:dihydrofolate reductase family protein [Glaciibacter sp. 2TAF33]|uniref:dihydrofolate reductase family protein n=1 Tax=Glaciibacter sp. 2TAF33 TaxID=3233015 RepID=UPI003F92039E